MKYGKSAMSMLFASVLLFIGTLAIKTPTCLGWFYEPEKPKGLNNSSGNNLYFAGNLR